MDSSSISTMIPDIIEDGVVDAEEVQIIKEKLYEDGIIDMGEVEDLFAINDAVSGNANDPSWQTLFVNAVSDAVLKDEISPGVVDEDEGKTLAILIGNDGKVDDVEKALLLNLKENATEILSPELNALIEENL